MRRCRPVEDVGNFCIPLKVEIGDFEPGEQPVCHGVVVLRVTRDTARICSTKDALWGVVVHRPCSAS